MAGDILDFRYRAKAQSGGMRHGRRSGENEAEVVAWIRDQYWIPIEVSKVFDPRVKKTNISAGSALISWEDLLNFSSRIKLKDKLVFFRQLSTMVSAGITITRSMEILAEQTVNRRFRRIILKVFSGVSSGVTLTNALAEYPEYFDVLVTSLVKSGEESGTLDISLSRISCFMEDQDNLRKKIVSAVTYPAAVIAIASAVLGVMLIVVVPQFQKAFSNLNIKMPVLTRMLFDLGGWLSGNWFYIPLFLFVLVSFIYFLKNLESTKYHIDSSILKIPVFGSILYKASISRSFRTMSSLLQAGVPVLKTLELAGDVAGNEKLRRGFYKVRDAAAMGVPMHFVMEEKRLFPPMICYMVSVGEESGRTDEMLSKVADWYEAELSETIKRLSSILEPVLVVFVGGIVGMMVLAIFLPIITAMQAFM